MGQAHGPFAGDLQAPAGGTTLLHHFWPALHFFLLPGSILLPLSCSAFLLPPFSFPREQAVSLNLANTEKSLGEHWVLPLGSMVELVWGVAWTRIFKYSRLILVDSQGWKLFPIQSCQPQPAQSGDSPGHVQAEEGLATSPRFETEPCEEAPGGPSASPATSVLRKHRATTS